MSRRYSKVSEKKHVAYGLASDYSVRALRVSQYMDHGSSRSLEKFGEDILTIPEVIRAQTLNFKPNFKFSRSFGCAISRLDQSLARIKI